MFHYETYVNKKMFQFETFYLLRLYNGLDWQYQTIMDNLILISQVQRSGGTLLTQLFDGHPHVSVFPGECMLLKGRWPNLRKLYHKGRLFAEDDRHFRQYIESGYMKSEKERLEFNFDFKKRDKKFNPGIFPSEDRILKSFFEVMSPGKNIMAFCPNLITDLSLRRKPRENYFYKGGRMISVIRDPGTWYLSARGHSPKYQEDCISKHYIPSIQGTLGISQSGKFANQCFPVLFSDLTTKTEGVMRHLSNKLSINYDPCLLRPTFRGQELWSDGSYKSVKGKVSKKKVDRSRTKDDIDWHLAWKLYDKCRTLYSL